MSPATSGSEVKNALDSSHAEAGADHVLRDSLVESVDTRNGLRMFGSSGIRPIAIRSNLDWLAGG